ncbi:MAG: fasciclin domain-containing protein, partial [Piscinibacter sp.]
QVATTGGFTALVAAADKAGLVPALSSSSSNLTVFAPTDAAFTSLATSLGFADAAAMVAALDGPTLASILQYHVLPTKQLAADLAAGGPTQDTLYTFDGAAATLALDTTSGVKITDEVLTQATVTTANVAASNGVIHVIDKVLVPPGVLNVVQMAQLNPAFSTLVGAVVSANLQGALADPAATLTVFAPTNDAFAAIASTVAGLNTTQLTTVLTYHVLGSQVLAAGIPFGTPVATLSGQDITINAGTPPTITDTTATPASIVATDVRASNGVIHVIDKVLIPAL